MMINHIFMGLLTIFERAVKRPILLYASIQNNNNNTKTYESLRGIRLRGFSLGIIILLSVLLIGQVVANASMCIIPEEEGSWENYDFQTGRIMRLDFRTECRDASIISCSESICCITFAAEAHYFIHLFGNCYCDWGEVEGEQLSGDLKGWYRFIYDHGCAMRYVYVQTYPNRPYRLRLWMYTDFIDPDRDDYVIDEWFHPEENSSN